MPNPNAATRRHGEVARFPVDRLVMVLLVREDDEPGSRGLLPTYAVRDVASVARRTQDAGITALKVFATDNRDRADLSGTRGEDDDSVMARAIRAVKITCPGLEVMTETCLCAYLPTGECQYTGADGGPAETVAALGRQAVAQARAGADVIGPAAMVPGSVSACRRALDAAGFDHVRIMPHLIVDSQLYGDYRTAMGIRPRQERRPRQLPISSQTATAVQTGLEMITDGADALLIEPALFAVDILAGLHAQTGVPLLPFSVSGECTTLTSSLLAEEYEMLLRAGASRVISHAALTLADTLGTATPSATSTATRSATPPATRPESRIA